jgi:arsenite methyltransferase
MIRSSAWAEREYAIIDVRRNDHAGGHVAGSIQRHAQTFYDELASFHDEFGTKKKVVFYCSSSNGRGPRCAGWFQDYLNLIVEGGEGREIAQPEVLVLEGGVKKWMKTFTQEDGAKDLVAYD